MIYFTADTHFGHEAMIRHYRTAFSTVDEMDQGLINNWNSVIGPKDTIYHLGDFAFHNSKRIDEILAVLNGEIHIVMGNHDHRGKIFSSWGKLRFKSIQSFLEIKPNGTPLITLCHYPMFVWNRSHFGSWHLHGHSHGTCKAPGMRWDVGVDNNNLTPVCIDDLHQIMNTKTISYPDYHKGVN